MLNISTQEAVATLWHKNSIFYLSCKLFYTNLPKQFTFDMCGLEKGFPFLFGVKINIGMFNCELILILIRSYLIF